MYRVREAITRLNYADLVMTGVIPDLLSVFPPKCFEVKRYPPWIYKAKDYSGFGLFVEMVVRKMAAALAQEVDFGDEGFADILTVAALINPELGQFLYNSLNIYQNPQKRWSENLWGTYLLTHTDGVGSPNLQAEIENTKPFLENVCRDLTTIWPRDLLRKLYFNAEIKSGRIAGHPDILSEHVILDVKNTADFSKMAQESCLQILSYYVLAKAEGLPIQHIGLILPMQHTGVILDMSQWGDWRNFLDVLQMLTLDLDRINIKEEPRLLGWHIHKEKGSISTSLQEHLDHCRERGYCVRPAQMFLRPNRNGTPINPKPDDIASAKQLIEKHRLIYFTHAPYFINPSKPASAKDLNDDKWALDILRSDLLLTEKIGGCGVVFHVGKAVGMNPEVGLNKMEASIRYCLESATPRCPLILETPAGQGTELCTKIEVLSAFYNRFSNDDKKKLKICIDTCHVYACGYDPLQYLQQWEQLHGRDSISVVHYNDSECPCGAMKDRHAPIGKGHIGREKLERVLDWCIERNIPLIIE